MRLIVKSDRFYNIRTLELDFSLQVTVCVWLVAEN